MIRTTDVTMLLQRMADGDSSASEALLPIVYEDLRALAGGYFRGQQPDHTLQPTALVHEVFLRLVRKSGDGPKNRAHFMAIAATAMRQILKDHARAEAERVLIRSVDLHRQTQGPVADGTWNAERQLLLLYVNGEDQKQAIKLGDAMLQRLNESVPAEHPRHVELRFYRLRKSAGHKPPRCARRSHCCWRVSINCSNSRRRFPRSCSLSSMKKHSIAWSNSTKPGAACADGLPSYPAHALVKGPLAVASSPRS